MYKKKTNRNSWLNPLSRRSPPKKTTGSSIFRRSQNTKKDLQDFYDQEAKKYHQTRQKFRKDAEYLLKELEPLQGKKIRILEFGCGSGRFAKYLTEHYKGKYDYTGVDFSPELIYIAKKIHPTVKRVCSEISEFIVTQKQESFDVIVGTSCFQHIPSHKERLFLMKHFYRALKYEGKLLMLNRAYSQRFFHTYLQHTLRSFRRYLISFWRKDRRDVLVPRINNEKISLRFYHLFSLQELKKLSQFSGFNLKTVCFIHKDGHLTQQEKHSKSSLLVAEKNPITTPSNQ